MTRTTWIPLLVLPLFFSTSCMGVLSDPLGRQHSLKEAQRDYTKFVRWGDIEAASEYVDPAVREAFLGYGPVFEDLRITEFDISKISYGEGRTSASVRVTYHGYSVASLIEKQIRETHEWVRPGRGNTWWVRPDLDYEIGGITEAKH